MNDIRAEEQRNVQAALFHGQMLVGIGALGADGVEHGTNAAGGSQLHDIEVIGSYRVDGDNHACLVRSRWCAGGLHSGGVAGIVVLNQLSDLLFQRHAAEQTVNTTFDFGIGQLRVGWMPVLGGRPRSSCLGIRRSHKGGDGNAEGTTGEEAAKARVRPQSGRALVHEVVSLRWRQLRFPPGHGHCSAWRLPADGDAGKCR